MVLAVIPQIIPFLEMMGGEMPWNTRLLVNITTWVTENVLTGAYVLGTVVPGFMVAGRTRRGRLVMDNLKMKLPLFGQLISYAMIVQFAKVGSAHNPTTCFLFVAWRDKLLKLCIC